MQGLLLKPGSQHADGKLGSGQGDDTCRTTHCSRGTCACRASADFEPGPYGRPRTSSGSRTYMAARLALLTMTCSAACRPRFQSQAPRARAAPRAAPQAAARRGCSSRAATTAPTGWTPWTCSDRAGTAAAGPRCRRRATRAASRRPPCWAAASTSSAAATARSGLTACCGAHCPPSVGTWVANFLAVNHECRDAVNCMMQLCSSGQVLLCTGASGAAVTCCH